ncbi:hypothetical protein [Bosea sp. 685]|uniref:hypothetical protein n=1 Tax=Bosea sp. 685 TaxID=3080057 RepID=UPI002892AFC4|nr:hypothetical protein [Bosea sp. 685]WNJ93742.1 hypothetical protein RMR04_16230 [Bosea sp. 685]
MSQPVGRDRNGLSFPQIVGPRDAKVLAVAAALESLLAGDPWAARLTPDIARLKAAPKLEDSPNVLGFDRSVFERSGHRFARNRSRFWILGSSLRQGPE